MGQLLTAGCEGKGGAGVAFEASRLARNHRDWQHVIELCALTEPLLSEDDGLWDPRQLNARLGLGRKGSRAAEALALMRQRARDAGAAKSQRGPGMGEVPVGGVRTPDDRRAKIADRPVQHAVAGGCGKCHALGSARQTMLGSRDAPLPRPAGQPGTAGREMLGRLPRSPRITQRLTPPDYAGALVSGRTEAKPGSEDGRARQSTRRKKPRERWRLLLLEHHPGSIRWKAFWQHQTILAAHRTRPAGAAGGAARRGPAWLGGW